MSVQLFGRPYRKVTGRILASASVQDHNTFEQPEKVKPREFRDAKLRDNNLQLTLPPFSVVVLELTE